MHLFYKKSLFIFVVLIFCFLEKTNAQTSNASFEILFKNEKVILSENFKDLNFQFEFQNEEMFDGKFFRVIQFTNIPDRTLLNEVKNLGIELLSYLPNKAYFASIPQKVDLEGLKKLPIRSISKIKKSWKKSPVVQNLNFGSWAFDGKNVLLEVLFFKNISKEKVIQKLKKQNIYILENYEDFPKIKIQIPLEKVEAVAAFPFVSFLDQVSEKGRAEDDPNRNLQRSNFLDADYAGGRHYDGTGIKVLVRDDGAVGPHIDFKGRLNQDENYGGGHGDLVTGIMGAAGSLNPKNRGVARGVEVFVRNYEESFLVDVLDLHQNENVLLTNSSYSNGCNAGYNSITSTVDLQLMENPTLMHFFSVGNSGNTTCGYTPENGWGTITGGHKSAKNAIAVGNVNTDGTLDENSSWGPATDGRLKPDFCANGVMTSTAANNQYVSTGGTSFSSPTAMGAAAQLYQAHKDLTGNIPDAALIKAVMMNTATDIGNKGPDFQTGFGIINSLRAVLLLENENYQSETIFQGENNSHNITITSGAKQVKVMLYWTDISAAANVSKALVNDLDLSVSTPNGDTFLPLVLDHSPNPTALNMVAAQDEDHLNNVEQIVIDNPVAGTYFMDVSGFEIPFGDVKYYLVYEIIEDEITVTYPNGGEGFVPGETEKIHWDAFDESTDYDLEYSSDAGNSWSTIATVSGTVRNFDWLVPNILGGEFQIRVKTNSISDVSDSNFSIAETPQNLSVEKVCYNLVRLNWEAVPLATAYEIFSLGEKYMESIGTTSDLFFDAPIDDPTAENWFAVQALGENGMRSRRTIAILHNSDLLDCPTENDLAADEIIAPISGVVTVCEPTEINVIFKIANPGINAQTNFEISYQLNNESPVTEIYQGNMIPGTLFSYTFNTPLTISLSGDYTLKTWVNSSSDLAKYNDSLATGFSILIADPVGLNVEETFENIIFPPQNWAIGNPDDNITWAEKEVIGSNGNLTKTAWMDNFSYNGNGAEDELVTVAFDLVGVQLPSLSFDVAYVPYSQFNFDSLRVDLYTDCGNIYEGTIYGASNVELASIFGVNTSDWEPMGVNDWKKEIISLADYADQEITLKFIGHNGFGNNLFLDNINVFDSTSPPIASFEFSQNEVCVGKSFSIFNNSNSNSTTTYFWDFGMDALPNNFSIGEGPHEIFFENAGLKTIQLIATNPNGTDTISQDILVVENPVGQFTFTEMNGAFTFENLSSNADSYLWDFGDGATSIEENPNHSYSQSGDYTISLTVFSNICDTSMTISEEVDVVVTDVKEIDVNFSCTVFPNPNSGSFYLKIENEKPDDFQVEILNVNGQIMDDFLLKNKNGISSQLIKYPSFSAGVYFIKIKNKRGVVVKKVIFQK